MTVIGGSGQACVVPETLDISFQATDLAGNTSTCTTLVSVVDTQPPAVTVDETVGDIEAAFSPADDELKTVTLADCAVQVVDACAGPLPIVGNARIMCVSSDEPLSQHQPYRQDPRDRRGHGPPPTPPDIVLVDDTTVQLRASRDNGGNGRVYTITFEAFDGAGNTSAPQHCKVLVSRHPGRPAVDSGPHETVCRPTP